MSPEASEPTGSTSSFMITTLIGRLNESLPSTEHEKLHVYQRLAAGAGSGHAAEWHRAYRCARWAVRVASQDEDRHLRSDAKAAFEIVREIEKALGAQVLDLESIPAGHVVSPRFEVELAWVEEAARVAARAAEKNGWSSVPWEDLLRELVGDAGTSSGPG